MKFFIKWALITNSPITLLFGISNSFIAIGTSNPGYAALGLVELLVGSVGLAMAIVLWTEMNCEHPHLIKATGYLGKLWAFFCETCRSRRSPYFKV